MSKLVADPYAAADEVLGFCGAQLSGTKRERPGQRIIWNANVCTKADGKIWYGDIDLNASSEKLRELAKELGDDVYVLREHDGRFQNETAPLLDNAVEVFTA